MGTIFRICSICIKTYVNVLANIIFVSQSIYVKKEERNSIDSYIYESIEFVQMFTYICMCRVIYYTCTIHVIYYYMFFLYIYFIQFVKLSISWSHLVAVISFSTTHVITTDHVF